MTPVPPTELTLRGRLLRLLWRDQDPFEGVAEADQPRESPSIGEERHVWFERLVRDHRPRIIVDVGTGACGATLQMAGVLKALGLPGVVIAASTWLGSQDSWLDADDQAGLRLPDGRPSSRQDFLRQVVARGLEAQIIPLPLDSATAAGLLRRLGVRADLIHLQASHDEARVRADLEAWWPVLEEGGFLVGAAYHRDGSLWPGVKAAWDAFVAANAMTYFVLAAKIRVRKVEEALVTPAPRPSSAELAAPLISPSVLARGQLEYTGEFGAELVLFLPFCHFLSRLGLLKTRRIVTYRGMRCFYDGLDCLEIVEKDQRRLYLLPTERPSWLPVRDEHSFDRRGRPPQHIYPDLRARFGSLPMPEALRERDRPLLIIHNKSAMEWNVGPINRISLACLDALFTALKRRFTIVYIRHGIGQDITGFSDDHNHGLSFDDRGLLNRHRDVHVFDDLHAAHVAAGGTQDLNTFKNVLYSRCFHFISSQGGGAHQIAMYSGALMAVLHRRGFEENWAYADGYYSFMARVPPILAICKDETELVAALPLFAGTAMAEDRVLLQAGSESILAALSPRTIRDRLAETRQRRLT